MPNRTHTQVGGLLVGSNAVTAVIEQHTVALGWGAATLATGDDAAALFALGPDAPPEPDRCCAVCNPTGEGSYLGSQTETGIYDGDNAPAPMGCRAFVLRYDVDEPTRGWHCHYFADDEINPVYVPNPSVTEVYYS